MKYFLLLFLLSVALSTGAVAFLWWLTDRAQMDETGTRYDCESGTWYVSEDGEIIQQKQPPHHNTPRK